jgi:hypothetical protein
MNSPIEKLYFSPIFSEAKCEKAGGMGIVYSGVNLAVWGVAVGTVAHLAGSKKAVYWGAGAFVALVISEIFFQASGHSGNVHTIAINPSTHTPPTAVTIASGTTPAIVTPEPVNGHQVAGFTELENEDYGATKNGYGNE